MNSQEQPIFDDIHLRASTPPQCPNAFACGEEPETKGSTSDSKIMPFLISCTAPRMGYDEIMNSSLSNKFENSIGGMPLINHKQHMP